MFSLKGGILMISETLLQSIRNLSVPDKLLLMQTIADMLRKELATYEQSASEQQNGVESDRLAQIIQDAQHDMSVTIAELLSRPKPTPEQMLPRGLFKGQLSLDDEDFRMAEWHPSEEELVGE
jgi:hypothetical protein